MVEHVVLITHTQFIGLFSIFFATILIQSIIIVYNWSP